jgi:hypothetical protein
MAMLLGLVGFIGSGKGTVAELLTTQHGFVQDSFAAPLKDAAANIFGWDRTLLEGATKESREWREEPDEFWSQAFGKPFTPRLALQQLGTEACRNGIHPDIWTSSLIKRTRSHILNVVVSDCRFMNEIEAIHKEGGLVVHVRRGPLPSWYDIARTANLDPTKAHLDALNDTGVHVSETAWIGAPIDATILNNDSLEDLEKIVAGFAHYTLKGILHPIHQKA